MTVLKDRVWRRDSGPVDPVDPTGDLPPPPNPLPTLHDPHFAICHYLSIDEPDLDVQYFATTIASLGATSTRAWLLSPWAANTGQPGCYPGYLPMKRSNPDDLNSPYDLYAWNEYYWARLRRFVRYLNLAGVVPVLTILNTYCFEPHKQGLPFVPDMDRLPWRHNVNTVRWGVPSADMLYFTFPDAWALAFLRHLLLALPVDQFAFRLEVGNEMPERALHWRTADDLRGMGYQGEITVSRNSDAPGQYGNMEIGGSNRRFSRISFHGKSDLGWLDEVFPHEPDHKTFRDFFARGHYEPARIILSSDGVGDNNPDGGFYDEGALLAVVRDAGRRGFSYEHQAREWKLGRFLQGRFRLDDLDRDFCRRLHDAWTGRTS